MRSGKKAFIQLIFALLLFGFILLWQSDFIRKIYFSENLTSLGLILNGAVFIIFLSGIVKLISAFLHYSSEEEQINIFVNGREFGDVSLFHRLSPKSIISRRYFKIKELYERKIPIHHGALTSVTLAEESLYQSYPRFVNNILILSGVFGTIISLILALTGASTVLKTSVAGQGMWLIIHGMNIALTTTATAIVCFFFFTFFYHKLTDVQTSVFGRVEDAVITHIVPEFTFEREAVEYKTNELLSSLEDTLREIKQASLSTESALKGINSEQFAHLKGIDNLVISQEKQIEQRDTLIRELQKINEAIVKGFRIEKS